MGAADFNDQNDREGCLLLTKLLMQIQATDYFKDRLEK